LCNDNLRNGSAKIVMSGVAAIVTASAGRVVCATKMRGDEARIDGNLTIDAHDSREIMLNAHFRVLAPPQALSISPDQRTSMPSLMHRGSHASEADETMRVPS
jgi:hypothetical protein